MSWRVRSMWYWFIAAAASTLAVVVQLFRKRRRHRAVAADLALYRGWKRHREGGGGDG